MIDHIQLSCENMDVRKCMTYNENIHTIRRVSVTGICRYAWLCSSYNISWVTSKIIILHASLTILTDASAYILRNTSPIIKANIPTDASQWGEYADMYSFAVPIIFAHSRYWCTLCSRFTTRCVYYIVNFSWGGSRTKFYTQF